VEENVRHKSLKDLHCALQEQWKRYRKALRWCQGEFSGKAIHNWRVQTRRLLATVALLGDLLENRHLEQARRALKRHLDALDDLRDTQVQLQAVGKLLRRFPGARPFQAYLLKREKRFRKEAGKKVRRIRTRRLQKLVAACRKDVNQQLDSRAPKEIAALLLRSAARAFGRTRQRWERITPEDARTIHRTRVAFKRFRYMAEALAEYLPAMTDARMEAMQHYQTMMGEIQDADVLLQALDKFLRKRETASETARRFREELLRRRRWLVRVYLGAANELFDFWPLPQNGGTARADQRQSRKRKL
jgi:CHAD domain-containing protein